MSKKKKKEKKGFKFQYGFTSIASSSTESGSFETFKFQYGFTSIGV